MVMESDPHGINQHSPGAKLDSGKLRPWLCLSGFVHALEEVAKVTTIGANKYTPNGWKEVPNGIERYDEAFARHMFSLAKGEVYDNAEGGTGCMHKAQMIWNLLASLELELQEQSVRNTPADRGPRAKVPEIRAALRYPQGKPEDAALRADSPSNIK